ncbi:TlpA disulfide reductase family protein [Christiangramia forsetii]|uniref:AhpC/TSA family thiol-disulfide oxidoreductase n=2 Tax=Christiangramia forsetii TaxID=411153 RepID=A0M322_CHRFK|nr:TlpA disulfide reductase family protein [Christiangramia forsetii]GGG26989.1 thiol:disulfide interchange protein [Christiangramia forsetii]CAL67017.1 AhpC/TSA family thiol-disulfide oxidoreductase [Christiangramia forsetii KT0803]
MKKISILFVALALVLVGCEEDKGYFLSGNISGLEDGKQVYIAEYDASTNSTKALDTTTVQEGKFEIDMGEQDLPKLSFLRFEGVNGNVIFISENQKINFEINKDSLRNTRIKGGKENKALSEYLDHLNELNRKMGSMQQDMRQAMTSRDTAKLSSMRKTQLELRDNDENFKKELFNRNKDSYLSVMLLTDMLKMRSLSSAEVREMYAEVSDRIKETPMAQNLKEALEQSKAAEIGSKAPEFSGPTPDGGELALSESLGKVTIVDFWAAWCKPCRVENPNLVRTYNKYKDQGLNIISVSLDRPGQKERWLKAIEEDKLEQWNHVSNLQFWNDPIAKKYKVTAIPAMFVLDENGVIVAKNLRGDALANKIGELIQ